MTCKQALPEDNTHDDHHQPDHRQQQRAKVQRQDFLQDDAHLFFGEGGAFGAGHAHDTPDKPDQPNKGDSCPRPDQYVT